MIGGIEAGGTTFRCAVGHDAQTLLHDVTIPTRGPDETLADVLNFFRQHGPVNRLGVASFGPVEVDPGAVRYGEILKTPKREWQDVPLLRVVSHSLGAQVAIHTDVMAAAMAECALGAGRPLDTLVYVTVGTGVGGAQTIRGEAAPGRMHAEMGHILVPRHESDVSFESVCPFHSDCLEGLAGANAIRARWGQEPHALPEDHPAWELEAFYLGALCVSITRSIAPARILLGGGVMRARGLLNGVREHFNSMMGGYHSIPSVLLHDYIMKPELEPNAGLIGAMLLAERLRCAAVPSA